VIKLIIFLVLIAGAFYFGYDQGLDDCYCVQTQNYLSTPFLADPTIQVGEKIVLTKHDCNLV